MEFIELKEDWFIRVPTGFTWYDIARCRFDPATIAIVGSSLMAYGYVREGQIARAEGKVQRDLAEYNAAQKERQAASTMAAARLEDERLVRKQKMFKGRKTVQIGKSGFALDDVSGIETMANDVYDMAFDRSMAFRGALIQGINLRQGATIDRIRGKWLEKYGKYQRNVSYAKAGASILSGMYMASQASSPGIPPGTSGNLWAGTNTSSSLITSSGNYLT